MNVIIALPVSNKHGPQPARTIVTDKVSTWPMLRLKDKSYIMLAAWAKTSTRFIWKLNRVWPQKIMMNSMRPKSQKKMQVRTILYSASSYS